MISKLIGKVLGEIVASPITVASEVIKAGEETINQTGKAIDRAFKEK